MSEPVTQEQIAVGSSNFVEVLITDSTSVNGESRINSQSLEQNSKVIVRTHKNIAAHQAVQIGIAVWTKCDSGALDQGAAYVGPTDKT